MKHFIKRAISLMLVAVMLILSLLLGGCSLFQTTGLEGGFRERPTWFAQHIPNFKVAYKSDKREFDLDNVTMDFYYGHLIPGVWMEETTFYIEFENGDKKILVKTINGDDFFNGEYTVDWSTDTKSIFSFSLYDYNHHETITIPRELFVGEKGSFRFQMSMKYLTEEGNGDYREGMAGVRLYYKVDGDKVILSDKEFWF